MDNNMNQENNSMNQVNNNMNQGSYSNQANVNVAPMNNNMYQNYAPQEPMVATGWTTTYAVLLIIGGALNCLTIIGAIWGIPLIIIATRFLDAAKSSGDFARTNNVDIGRNAINSFLKGFKGYIILMLVMIAVSILFFVIAIAIGISLY